MIDQLKKNKVLFLISLMFILLLVLNYYFPALKWDENAYLGNARSHIAKSNFTEDFRYPLLEYFIAFFWLFTGESVFIAKLLIMVFTLSTIYIFYLTSEIYFKKDAFIITLLFSLSPLIFEWGYRVYSDIPALFFLLLSFYLILISNKKQKIVFLAGIAGSLAFLMRFPAALFPFSAGIYFLFKKEYKKSIVFSLGFMSLLLPWMIYNYAVYSNPFWDFFAQWEIVAKYTLMEPPIYLFKNLMHLLNVLLFFLPFGIYSVFKEKRDKKIKNSFILISTYILIFLTVNSFIFKLKLARYSLIVLPFFCIFCYKGFLFMLNCFKKYKQEKYYRIIAYSVLFFILISFFISALITEFKQAYCGRGGAIEQSIDYIKKTTTNSDHILSNFWPSFGYSANVKVNSLWSENVSSLISQYDSKYIVLSQSVGGVYFNKTLLDKTPELELEKKITDRCNCEAFIYRVKAS